MCFHLYGPFLYWLPFNHSFLRLFIMVTAIEQIFMSDHLHKFGTEVLCFQKWPLLSGCGRTESLILPDVAGYQGRLCNALVFLMLLDLAISIHKWESTVSCSPYQREHPTLKERRYHLGYLDIFPPGPGQLYSTFTRLPLRMLLPPPRPPVPTFYFVSTFDFFSPSFFSVFTNCFSAFVHKGTSPPIPLRFSLVPTYNMPTSISVLLIFSLF